MSKSAARTDVESRREIGLFRYALVRDAADPGLSKRERGRLVRAVSEREHVGQDGRPVRVTRGTLDEWIRAYRHGGFEALVPQPRVRPLRTPAGMLELAFAAQARAAGADRGAGPGDHARHRRRRRACAGGADAADPFRPPGAERPRGRPVAGKVYGRFEAAVRNELWTGDGLHGPKLAGAAPAGRCCLRSSMTTPGCWSGGGGGPARTCSGSRLRCAPG